MNILFCLCVLLIAVMHAEALICRTREHMKQQQDFYNLASNCMKSTMNVTTYTNSGSWDYRQQQQQKQQQQQQQQNLGNRQNYNNHYDNNRHHDNRYDRNKVNFRNNDEEMPRDPNSCNTRADNAYDHYHNNNYKDESHHQRYREKRDMMVVQKYVRKNSTTAGTKKSPIEEIGACVIHCIFREMKMLNSDSKVDRQSMIHVMTSRIHDLELKEFIQDSIEECFDITDSDNHEEQCDFSKKIILCLEEKAKRGCEDWEIPENSTHTSNNFNFNKQSEERNNGDHRHKY